MSKSELRYAVGWAAVVMAATCIPYLVVWFYTPHGAVFPGILFNSDDHGAYFAWMRQARDGHLLFRNLFTNEPQRGIYLHVLFLVLGWISWIPGLSIPLAYHVARVGLGILTLVLVYRLACFFTPDGFARRCVVWVTALSAGLGWLRWRDLVDFTLPADVWQPEATTFQSLYTNGLFCAALALMLGFVICLLLAEERGWKWAAGAGVCGLLLGNVHSYDVIHLAVVWGLYLLARWVIERRFPARAFGYAALAGAIAAPSVLYMAWLYTAEPVFRLRADVPTRSGPFRLYALGYGLLLPLAAWGCWLLWNVHGGAEDAVAPLHRDAESEGHGDAENRESGHAEEERSPASGHCVPASPPHRVSGPNNRSGHHGALPAAWVIGGFIAAYLPFAFNRKMIMGEHLALSLLAGIAVSELARRVGSRASFKHAAALIAVAVVALLAVSNLRFLVRDVRVALRDGMTSTRVHPVYWPESDLRAFQWYGAHSTPDDTLLTFPMNGVLAPAYSDRTVYVGHWGETPHFPEKLEESMAFYTGRMSPEERRQFLVNNRISYVLYGPMEREYLSALNPPASLDGAPELAPVYRDGDLTLYRVQASASP